jgi:hypothetical protein
MKIRLTENERESISSQHEEFDSRILNFLMRRIKVEERKIGGNWGDFEPLTTTEYTFEDFPGYGFTSYQAKSYWTRQILELLEEAEIIPEDWHGDPRVKESERQKIIKTVRKFIKNVLTK